MNIPSISDPLSPEHIKFLETFSKSCRHSIIAMLKQSQSGHPGGSLSCIDYLSLIYAFIIGQTGEKVVVSNGHISPGVYSTLAEMGYIPKQEVIDTFRKIGSIYEGHITRHVDGIWYGTGPLGIGVSVAASYAHGEKMRNTGQKVFAVMGDGEAQEGQVHEMIHFAKQHELNNLIVFVDYNKVQLTASLEEIIDIDIHKTFEAGHWEVIDVDGHDFAAMWQALQKAYNSDKPVALIGNTIMGQGVASMEQEGVEYRATWHGKAPKPEQADEDLDSLLPTEEENQMLDAFRSEVKWHPKHAEYPEKLSTIQSNAGTPKLYDTETITDCRSAYGAALLDLAKNNQNVIALTADLKGSVKTADVSKELPAQYVECGIAEQNMVSLAGGYSLDGYIPFASTFGAFMTSRAKDQARVNDINYTNVKMVATHCGLSVGEDGPTHQAIDDKGSFIGFFNTMVLEPADPNQTDRIIRYVASHFGNFYVRMGRHKFPIITKPDGTPFYGTDYQYEYGKCDLIREGSDITIAASGPLVHEALKAHAALAEQGISAEIIAVSSLKKFDDTLFNSIKKTGKLITAEDHNALSGIAGQIALQMTQRGIAPEKVVNIAPSEYQLSGTAADLYREAGIDSEAIVKAAQG